jgi:hypothetical protein
VVCGNPSCDTGQVDRCSSLFQTVDALVYKIMFKLHQCENYPYAIGILISLILVHLKTHSWPATKNVALP